MRRTLLVAILLTHGAVGGSIHHSVTRVCRTTPPEDPPDILYITRPRIIRLQPLPQPTPGDRPLFPQRDFVRISGNAGQP
jgi:hypothetical protein